MGRCCLHRGRSEVCQKMPASALKAALNLILSCMFYTSLVKTRLEFQKCF